MKTERERETHGNFFFTAVAGFSRRGDGKRSARDGRVAGRPLDPRLAERHPHGRHVHAALADLRSSGPQPHGESMLFSRSERDILFLGDILRVLYSKGSWSARIRIIKDIFLKFTNKGVTLT